MNHGNLAAILAMLPLLIQPASAAENQLSDAHANAYACHVLMTEQECTAHLDTLSALPSGPERNRYLASFLETKREREQLCNHSEQHIVVYKTGVRQAWLTP